ncbi:MAG: hypothetical protein HYZ33_03005, partial [Ignavibacteriales bacterium]|nr:hypothetical protein [Ignavibacteriales bacterium]
MAKEFRAGFSFSDDRTQIVVAEFRDDGSDIKYVEELTRNSELAFYVLPPSVFTALKPFGKISKIGVSIETDRAMVQTYPMDASLSPSEQEEQIDWEWKNFVPDYSSNEFLQQTRILKSDTEEQTNIVLSTIIKHSLLNEIKSFFSSNNLQYDSLELHPATSERVLRFVHPDIKEKTVALICISHLRLDVLVLENGTLTTYKYGIGLQPKTAVEFLANELLEVLPEVLYVFGSALSHEWMKAMKSSLGVVVPLNPFRKFRLALDVKHFSRFLGH